MQQCATFVDLEKTLRNDSNEYLLLYYLVAKICLDTAERKTLKVGGSLTIPTSRFEPTQAQFAALAAVAADNLKQMEASPHKGGVKVQIF